LRRKAYKGIVQILCCFIIFALLQPMTIISAEELDTPAIGEIELPYETIRKATCALSINSGTATVSSVVNGKNGTTSINITVYLEKLVGGTWQPYTSWSHSGSTDIDTTDSTTVSHGAYRVWMSVSATGSNGNDSFTVDGNTVGY